MNWDVVLENDLNFARKRFEVEPFTHETFGEGFLVVAGKEEVKNFRMACFAVAIPLFSLDSYAFFLPKEPYTPTPKEIRIGKEKVVFHYPRVRAFDGEGREITERARKEAIILSGLSPFRSELYVLATYRLPYLLRIVQGRIWHKVGFIYLIQNNLTPGEAIEMARRAAIKSVARRMLINLAHENPWISERVKISLDHPVKSLWEVHRYLRGVSEESLVEEILRHR
jgi:hypothetical protein